MEDLAEKYVNDHNNPLVKLELIGTKLLLPSETGEEQDLVADNLEIQTNALRHARVDRRSGRIKAVWLNKENFAKVVKFSGSLLSHFGFQNSNGKFLHPEETLFLLETNKLELFLNNNPLSIQDAYRNCLKSINLNHYRIYKKLALQGYKITKSKEETNEESNAGEPSKKKRKIEENDLLSVKKPNLIEEMLEKLRKKGPKPSESDSNISNTKPNYFIYLPTNSDKKNPDFNLFIKEKDNDDFSGTGNSNDIFAVCSTENLAFYKLKQLEIPVIPAIDNTDFSM